jgi:16S rRNA C967 or C1407 C5-methylase (RsmB/RsmF family)/NOL1/NOP2/fmu family ribosome biogenesis protein
MSVFPEAFNTQMQLLLGSETASFFSALESDSPVSIRYNPLKNIGLPTELQKVPWASAAFYLPERPLFTADPLFHAGTYYVQEAASMFLEQALNQYGKLSEKLRILDLCAAPGGKSTLIASLINRESLLVSNEVIRSRAHILSENLQKWGKENVWVSNNDPLYIANTLPSFFDIVVVDAPCSGEGMFRKAANSIEEWSPQALNHCSLRQQRILHDIWKSLRPGGILIYSTCTYNETENEQNLAKFKESCDFDSLKLSLDKSWGVTETNLNDIFGYRFYPHLTKGEGFFLSILKKSGDKYATDPKIRKNILAKAGKDSEILQNWYKNPDLELFKRKELIIAVPKSMLYEAQLIESTLNIVSGAAEMAELNRKGFIPSPAAALWSGLNKELFAQSDLDLENALKFLHLENIKPELTESKEGWQLITYKGIGLGWIKKLSSRVNNYYPKEWRIRMSLDKLI